MREFLFFVILIVCTSCSKMYSIYDAKNRIADLNMIEVVTDNSAVSSAEFTDHIQDLLGNYAADKKYKLETKFEFISSALAIQRDSDVIRDSVILNVKFTLHDLQQDKLIYDNNFRLMSSFNTTYNAFSSHIEEERIKSNLARNAAEEIVNRLIIYFTNR